MATTYTGVPTNVTTPHAATISSGTNATPVVITTAVPHLFGNGDTVRITGTGTALDTNTYVITVTGAQVFSLNGTTASGVISTGTATDQSLTPQFQIPSDGDDFDVGSINPALQTLADRTQYLQKQNLSQEAEIATLTGRAYITARGATRINGNSNTNGSSGSIPFTISNIFTGLVIAAGDVLEVELSTSGEFVCVAGDTVSAIYTLQYNGTNGQTVSSFINSPGGETIVFPISFADSNALSAGTYHVDLVIVANPASGSSSWGDNFGGGVFPTHNVYQARYRIWRNT